MYRIKFVTDPVELVTFPKESSANLNQRMLTGNDFTSQNQPLVGDALGGAASLQPSAILTGAVNPRLDPTLVASTLSSIQAESRQELTLSGIAGRNEISQSTNLNLSANAESLPGTSTPLVFQPLSNSSVVGSDLAPIVLPVTYQASLSLSGVTSPTVLPINQPSTP